jgi:hypothetical protein
MRLKKLALQFFNFTDCGIVAYNTYNKPHVNVGETSPSDITITGSRNFK